MFIPDIAFAPRSILLVFCSSKPCTQPLNPDINLAPVIREMLGAPPSKQ